MSNGQDNTGSSASNDNRVDPESGEETERVRRLKRIRFRSWHRGIKEMDILMGGFADKYLAELTDEELDAFETVMTVPDQELYAMLVRDAPHWPELDEGMMARLMAYSRRES
ncbi:succinate dehydrogenase assembly factor 2 [Hwanghaeella grinnelliae]|uniref:FAD assembly factor SdhE n=1 Tax=Hwanghaeella grinnelliae TaxID=2500179 RepID=UPI00195FCD77|nr:succinate dehydrogenase assembly factor 2 [Hwanghaeella grinnelliae]